MTAPISNGPTTTRLHHYAGHYSCRMPHWNSMGVICRDREAFYAALFVRHCGRTQRGLAQSSDAAPAGGYVGPLMRVWAR